MVYKFVPLIKMRSQMLDAGCYCSAKAQESCCADHVQQKEKATKVVHLATRKGDQKHALVPWVQIFKALVLAMVPEIVR